MQYQRHFQCHKNTDPEGTFSALYIKQMCLASVENKKHQGVLFNYQHQDSTGEMNCCWSLVKHHCEGYEEGGLREYPH